MTTILKLNNSLWYYKVVVVPRRGQSDPRSLKEIKTAQVSELGVEGKHLFFCNSPAGHSTIKMTQIETKAYYFYYSLSRFLLTAMMMRL